jgi:hypothetical protein
MTPEELARAGRDPSAYYGDYDAIRRKVLAGELPEEMLSGRGATTIRPGTTNTRNFNPAAMYERFMNSIGGFTKNIDEPGGLLKNPEGNYRRSGGGKTGAAFGALETTLQDPVAGIISAPIGIGAGQLANMATTSLTQGMLQGPLPLKAAGMALRYLAPATVGYQAQQATARGVQQLTGSAPQAVAGAVASGGGGGGGGGGGFYLGLVAAWKMRPSLFLFLVKLILENAQKARLRLPIKEKKGKEILRLALQNKLDCEL